MDALVVATLNIRHFADRWAERLPLLLADMAALQPDLMGLQEVVFPMEQDRLLASAGSRRYRVERGWAGRPEYGNSLLVNEDLPIGDAERLDLDSQRSAHRARIALPGGASILVTVTHLHHAPADVGLRDSQTAALVAWLDDAPPTTAQVVVGDFNAEPDEPTYAADDRGGLPICLPRGEWRGARRDLAVGAPGAGDGHRRRARLPRLRLAPRRRHGSGGPPRLRPACGRRPDALPVGPHRPGRPHRCRVSRPLLLAHRGDHRRHTENTIAAFLAALAVPGCDGLELDVRTSADGVAVVIHDDSLSRVQHDGRLVRSLWAAELEGIGVPTLAAVLAAVPPPAFLDVELKEPVAADAVAEIRRSRGDPPSGVVVSSFDSAILDEVRVLAPTWPTWLNTRDLGRRTIAAASRIGCAGVAVQWRGLSKGSVAAAHAAGLDVAAWTVRRRATADRLAAIGVVAICVEGRALDPR